MDEEKNVAGPVLRPSAHFRAHHPAFARARLQKQSLDQPTPTDERRVDSSDGCLYTRAEFVAFYGGTEKWDSASTSNAPINSPLPVTSDERRIDPVDGNRYTKEEFLTCYGGSAEWEACASLPGVDSIRRELLTSDEPSTCTDESENVWFEVEEEVFVLSEEWTEHLSRAKLPRAPKSEGIGRKQRSKKPPIVPPAPRILGASSFPFQRNSPMPLQPQPPLPPRSEASSFHSPSAIALSSAH